MFMPKTYQWNIWVQYHLGVLVKTTFSVCFSGFSNMLDLYMCGCQAVLGKYFVQQTTINIVNFIGITPQKSLKNSFIIGCGSINGPAIYTEGKVDLLFDSGRIIDSTSYISGAVYINPSANLVFKNVTFEDNIQKISNSYLEHEWRHSGAAVTVADYNSAPKVNVVLVFEKCYFS